MESPHHAEVLRRVGYHGGRVRMLAQNLLEALPMEHQFGFDETLFVARGATALDSVGFSRSCYCASAHSGNLPFLSRTVR